MEHPFDQLPGVVQVLPGYTGGSKDQPTYEEVSAGGTGHAESVEITYDPSKISYTKLLDVFWHQIDPTTPDAQFCDHGHQYRSAIFYTTDEQRQQAEASKAELAKSGPFKAPIVTEITKATTFSRQRVTISTTTRRIRYGTNTTATRADGTSTWTRYGARTGPRTEGHGAA